MKSFLEFLIENENQSSVENKKGSRVWVIAGDDLSIVQGLSHKEAFSSIYFGGDDQTVPRDKNLHASSWGSIVKNRHGIDVVNIVTSEGPLKQPQRFVGLRRVVNQDDIDTRKGAVEKFQNHFGGDPFLIDAGENGFHTATQHIKHLDTLAGHTTRIDR